MHSPDPHDYISNAIRRTIDNLAEMNDTTILIEWTPGHQSNPGNETAHRMASVSLRTSQNSRAMPAPLPEPALNSPVVERRIRKMRRRRHLKETTPRPDPPVPEDIPRGLQVLLHKARSGTAVTPDVRDRWTWYRRFGRKRPDGSTPVPPPTLPCPLCSADQPTIHHLLWNCAGLSEERRRCLPPHVTSLQEWITPSSDVKEIY